MFAVELLELLPGDHKHTLPRGDDGGVCKSTPKLLLFVAPRLPSSASLPMRKRLCCG